MGHMDATTMMHHMGGDMDHVTSQPDMDHDHGMDHDDMDDHDHDKDHDMDHDMDHDKDKDNDDHSMHDMPTGGAAHHANVRMFRGLLLDVI